MNNINRKYTYAQVDSSKIHSDQRYQRPVDQERVRKIAREYDPDQVEIIKVSKRDDGKYYVFDGQHTLEALKLLNGNRPLKVDCKVYRGLTVEDEAMLFARQDVISRPVSQSDRMKALCLAGDDFILELKNCIESLGICFDFSKDPAPMKITAYNAARDLYKKAGKETFGDILTLIAGIWPDQPQAFAREIMNGLYEFQKRFAGEYDPGRLGMQLASKLPEDIIQLAKTCNLSRRSAFKYAYAIAVVYNDGIQEGQVDVSSLFTKREIEQYMKQFNIIGGIANGKM